MKHYLCTALAALILSTPSSRGALPDLAFTFEQGDDPGLLNDTNEGYAFRAAPEAAISQDAHRFGSKGLLINASEKSDKGDGTGWEVMLRAHGLESFKGETRQMTISVWVRLATPAPFIIFRRIPANNLAQGFFQFTYLGGEKGRLYYSMTGEGEAGMAPTFQAISPEPASVLPGEWTHLAMTFSEGEIRFYANGSPVGKATFIEAQVIPNAFHELSSMKALSGVGEGTAVDDFGFFGSRALDDHEIAALYRNGLQAFQEKTP